MRRHKMGQDGFDMYRELNAVENSYYDFYRVKNKGMMYVITRPINDEFKAALLKKYSNIEFYLSQCQYAKEIKHNAILVCDKCIK